MRTTMGLLVTMVLALFAGSVEAEAMPGTDYVVIDGSSEPGRGAAAGPGADRIEVVEFFSYACPHCAHLEPQLEKWRHRLPANAVLRRVPVIFGRDEWETLARLYFTLEAADQVDALHAKVFAALHGEHVNLFSAGAIADWMARQGKDRRAFLDRFNSFAVQVHLQGANALVQQYGIDSVPSFVVAGRYRTDLDMARDYGRLLGIVDELVRKSGGVPAAKR